MRVRSPVLWMLAAALPAMLLAGCKSDSSGPSTSANLAGTYSLQAITFQGQPSVGPPIATGTFTLTNTTYTVSINVNVPGQSPESIQDAGTYTLSGNTWSQTSTVQGCPTACLQSVGTFSLSGNTLTVNVTTMGSQVVTVWTKQ